MIKVVKRLLGREYLPLNKVEISKNDLISNYSYLSKINSNLKIAPVVKSNAYGHGIKEVAPILDSLNPPFLCVDSLYEAYELKKLKIRSPILIMGYVAPQNLKIKKLPFSFTIYDFNQAEILNKHQKGAKVHIKVDTGMHRLGIRFEELPQLLSKIKELKNIDIEGIMSHFSSPKTFPDYTDFQIKNFITALKSAKAAGINAKYVHIGASGGLLNAGSKLSGLSNMVRVGISLYGLYRTKNSKNIKPVLTLKSQIVQIKKINKGEYVGYDKAYQAEKDVQTAVLPIGYNDGVDRRLTNTGFVKVKGKYAKIIGKVSMNITSIDITGINAKVGDTVEIFSKNPSDLNSVEKAAELCGTIPHDLMVHLHPKALRREVI